MARARDVRTIRNSRFFDADWYRRQHAVRRRDPAGHYLDAGAAAGLDPGPEFSTRGYLAANPDVAAAGLNPLLHYELHGRAEGRSGFVPEPQPATVQDLVAQDEDHAVIVHAYHPECFAELGRALDAFPDSVDRYVSYPRGSQAHSEDIIRAAFPGAILVPVDNLGQDVGAFLQVLRHIGRGRYAFFCKLHSKMGDKLPAIWREALIRGTVGNPERVAQYVRIFRECPEVVLGGPRELYLHGSSYLMKNGSLLGRMLERGGLSATALEADWGFFAGTFLWMRESLAERMLACLLPEDFAPGDVLRDGQAAHAGERLSGLLAQATGGHLALASCVDPAQPVEVVHGAPRETVSEMPVPMMERLGALQARWTGLSAKAMLAGRVSGLGAGRGAVLREAPADYAIVTPTGDRPAAFNRCIRMVTRQSLQPREWIVVDDGAIPLTDQLVLPDWVTYVRRAPVADDPPHTLSRNMLAALDHVTADRVLIFEDDDWYAPLYAEYLLPWLDCHDLVGLNLIRYYHLRGRAWKTGHPSAHTAFAQSAFRRGHAWDHLAAVCRTEFAEIREKGIVDRHWWTTFEGTRHLLNGHPGLHLGLKGGFGRPGLASGHDRAEVDYIPDPDGSHLAGMLGPDLPAYARWQEGPRKPYALYTGLTEGGGAVSAPDARILHCDFHAFAEDPGQVPAPWRAQPFDEGFDMPGLAAAKAMSLPHLYFPDYEWSIWCPQDHVPEVELERLVARAIETGTELATVEGAPGVLLRHHTQPGVARAMTAWWRAQLGGAEPGAALAWAAEAEGVTLGRL